MKALPNIKAQARVPYHITRFFTLLERHTLLLTSLVVFLSAYFFIIIHSRQGASGIMADTKADSPKEHSRQSAPPPSSPSLSAREKMDNTHEGEIDKPREEEEIGNTQEEEKEKMGNTLEDSTEDLPTPSSVPPPSASSLASPSPSPSVPQQYEAQKSVGFKLTETCQLFLHRGDITTWFVDGHSDAIVNAANKRLLGGGGVDGAIHSAAGHYLLTACKEIPEVRPGVRCPVGSARITRGFELPASYIIHTVGPIYHLEEYPERKLFNAYRNSLDLARENEVKYIAFPAISCGVYGYPYEEAAELSLNTVRGYASGLKEVHFVLFEEPAWEAWVEKANELFEQA